VPPDRFIAVLEDSGLILPVGAWAIRTACAELAAWDRAGSPRLSLAVNLSARQFRQPFLARFIADALSDAGIAPHRLELELTESLLLEDSEGNRSVLAALAEMGVRVAIDDFGTGHSSLSYLKRFDIDTLKIDRSFVADVPHDSEDAAIATAIVAMGHSLHMKVVAEGVETMEQAEFLLGLGCDEIQGFLISRPLPGAQMQAWLAERVAGTVAPGGGSGSPSGDSGVITLISLDAMDTLRRPEALDTLRLADVSALTR
jgi:EAL domain-containing protein (putative c-di-GMP-specific phosphodiesterase class I)